MDELLVEKKRQEMQSRILQHLSHKMLCLQSGQFACRTSQRSMQDRWNVWPHPARRRMLSPGLTSVRQMEHSCWHESSRPQAAATSLGSALIAAGHKPPCCLESTKSSLAAMPLTWPHLSRLSASSTPRKFASALCTRPFSFLAFTAKAIWTMNHT